jgi:zinc protease
LRRKPENSESLSPVNYDKINKIYKELLSNTNGLIFVFTGNITPAKAKHFVQVYIGGLPISEKAVTWKDENVRPLKGIVSKKLPMKMEVPKSSVFIGFAGEFQYTQSSPTIIDALQYILKMRFLETIREQEGGTYGVSVEPKIDIFPSPQYYFNIRFDCAPEKADYLTTIVYQQIKKLQSEGPTDSELQKTVEFLKKRREEDLKQNRFWNNVLVRKVYYGFDYYSVDNFDKLLQSLTSESLKTEAQKFFDAENRVELISMPEK